MLLGDVYMPVRQTDRFVDPGVRVYDNIDGNSISAIGRLQLCARPTQELSGLAANDSRPLVRCGSQLQSVNTTSASRDNETYVITYSARDAAGNQAVPLRRYITVTSRCGLRSPWATQKVPAVYISQSQLLPRKLLKPLRQYHFLASCCVTQVHCPREVVSRPVGLFCSGAVPAGPEHRNQQCRRCRKPSCGCLCAASRHHATQAGASWQWPRCSDSNWCSCAHRQCHLEFGVAGPRRLCSGCSGRRLDQ